MTRDGSTLSWKSFSILLALALLLGVFYRFPALGHRPMHTDEAILAMKTIDFWKSGHFAYDPHDFHGPALHYLTRVVGMAGGWTADTLTDVRLRQVVALCGMMLIAGVVLVVGGLGRGGAACAALLMAVSPMMVFYNRYFIMESLFVLLMFLFIAALWRWTQSQKAGWLVIAGICLGLMHATKETFVLNIAALFAGWLLVKITGLSFQKQSKQLSLGRNRDQMSALMMIMLVLVPAVLVSVTLYSSFFRDWQGVKDSVLTYKSYLARSGGSGHEKPWHYYLTLIFYHRNDFVWTEAFIAGLALIGMITAWTGSRMEEHRRAFIVLLTGYALASLVIYSMIPYKTPWSILATQHALTLLAGVGAAALIGSASGNISRVILIALFGGGLWHLCLQAHRAIDLYPADPRNPYVYSHSSLSAVKLSETVHELAKLDADGKNMRVQILDEEQGWPLPWYLRDMPHVGYQSVIPQSLDAPVIIADDVLESDVNAKLGGAVYESDMYVLRPGVNLLLMVKKDLWEKLLALRSKEQMESTVHKKISAPVDVPLKPEARVPLARPVPATNSAVPKAIIVPDDQPAAPPLREPAPTPAKP